MNKFEDVCPICGQEIAKEAVERGDAVICPDCGTSYHKACWEKAGGMRYIRMPKQTEGSDTDAAAVSTAGTATAGGEKNEILQPLRKRNPG